MEEEEEEDEKEVLSGRGIADVEEDTKPFVGELPE